MFYESTKEEPVYPIRTAAKILNISVHTIRMYEKENLIIPFKKSTNHRLFSKSDIDRINCIRSAINNSKISINGIKTIYAMMPCWELMNCAKIDQNNCSAYLDHHGPCWANKGENTKCASKNCRDCSVYKDYWDCGSIKKFIKTKLKSI
ncbi:MAG TPA: MerR family transcriptional regulator [Ignavibacteriales bacterium]|nr:MerR family transcriptional regulator [Ignavibacteriales bacterium]